MTPPDPALSQLRPLFVPRWKGENVATTEVEATLGLVDFIQEVNVYGVAVPGEWHRSWDIWGGFEGSPGGSEGPKGALNIQNDPRITPQKSSKGTWLIKGGAGLGPCGHQGGGNRKN